MRQAEHEGGRFDIRTALAMLEREATYRAEGATPQGLFLYRFECLSRNRLDYQQGMDAIAEEVNRVMKESGNRRLGLEGRDTGTWVLQDFGDIVLHIFSTESRELYDLEHLWGDAKRVDWQKLVAELPVLEAAGN
jgi:hypothetical protein